MQILDKILATLSAWASQLRTLDVWLELVVILASAGLAWVLHRRWRAYVIQRLGRAERQGLGRAALRGTIRAVFPVSMLLVLLAGRAVLAGFDLRIVLLNIFVLLLLSLAAIRLIVYVLRRSFTPSPALRAWEGIISSVIWGVVALHLVGWLPGVLDALDAVGITMGETRISLLSVGRTVLAVALFLVLASWLSSIIEQRVRRSQHLTASARVGVTKISKFLLLTLAVLVALDSVGVDLTTLTVFGGALGVGIGFGLQRIASNFISGFIVLFDRSIRPGDVISIGERFGWVQELRARYIVVRDREGVETLIPNENLITSEVTNWSYSDRHVRVKIPVQISYDDDPELAMQCLLEACGANPRVLNDPPPQSRLIGFGDNGINLQLRIWIGDPEAGVGSVRSDINLAIWRLFKQHAITIPFPQRDLRLVEVPPTALRDNGP